MRKAAIWFFSRNPGWYILIVTVVGFFAVWEKDFTLQQQDHLQQRLIHSENMIRLHSTEFQTLRRRLRFRGLEEERRSGEAPAAVERQHQLAIRHGGRLCPLVQQRYIPGGS